jgi:uncharacterized membrane-anchored protein YitT (DUF2179 family)
MSVPLLFQNPKVFSAKWFRDYALIFAGTFFISLGYVMFISPNKIVPGGIYGLSIVIHYLTKDVFSWAPGGLPIGITALFFNIPLTVIGTKILGPRFGIKTIVGFVLTAVYVDVLVYFHGDTPLVTDVLVSCLFGGLLIGLGVAMTFKAKATSGGSDVISMLVSKFTRRPLGQMMMLVDSTIVLFGFAAFREWQIPLYSWITIFVIVKVVEMVMHGLSYDKTLFIISDKHEELRERIIFDLHRGGTYLQGKGMYNQGNKQIIFTVVSPRELSMLQEYIHKIDPEAFIAVLDAYEILGKGFKSLSDKIEDQ